MNPSDDTDHGIAFIESFVVKERRSRLAHELKKGGFLNRFCHESSAILDLRYVKKIDNPISDHRQIVTLLKGCGAGETCYAMSMCSAIDRQSLPLADALAKAVGYGLPSIISCIPGQLAYLETEQGKGPPDRFILMKVAKASSRQCR